MTDQIFYTEGAKNTFFLSFSKDLSFADLRDKAIDESLDPDGYILAPKLGDNAVEFSFYNKDASMVDFCGNALRAVGLCFFEQFGEKEVLLKTAVGEMKVKVLGENDIKAQMPEPEDNGFLSISDLKVAYILSGVPHLVFNLEELSIDFSELDKIKEFCHKIRAMKLGSSKETFNLSFYNLNKDFVDCITFERGVEDFTQACGSGALSVFKALNEEYSKLKMPGGMLEISKESGEYYMCGPATVLKRI